MASTQVQFRSTTTRRHAHRCDLGDDRDGTTGCSSRFRRQAPQLCVGSLREALIQVPILPLPHKARNSPTPWCQIPVNGSARCEDRLPQTGSLTPTIATVARSLSSTTCFFPPPLESFPATAAAICPNHHSDTTHSDHNVVHHVDDETMESNSMFEFDVWVIPKSTCRFRYRGQVMLGS